MLLVPLCGFTQTPEDSLQVIKTLDRISYMLEDESKEDSIALLVADAGKIYSDLDRYPEFVLIALPHIRQVYTQGYLDAAEGILLDQVQRIENDYPQRDEVVAQIYYELARSQYVFRKYEAAAAYSQLGVQHRAEAGADQEVAAAGDFNLLGLTLKTLEQWAEARSFYEKALAIYRDKIGADSYEASMILNNLGEWYWNMGLNGKAVEFYEKAYSIREKVRGADHPSTANVLLNLGVVAKDKGNYQEGAKYLEKAVNIFLTQDGANSLRVGKLYYNLGVLNRESGSQTQAENYLQNALGIFRQQSQRPFDLEALVIRGLANLKADQNQLAESIRLRREVLKLQGAAYGSDHYEIAVTLDNIGVDFRELGLLDSSLYYHQRALNVLENDPNALLKAANVHNNLADTYIAKKDWEAARTNTRRALIHQQEILGDRHPALAYSYNTLARIALAENRPTQALEYAHAGLAANHESLTAIDNFSESPATGYLRHDYYFESLFLKAEALQEPNPIAALRQYQVADQVLTAAKNSLISREDKINQSQNVYRLTQAAIPLCLQLQATTQQEAYLAAAFYFAEKSKASVLLQSINANSAKHFAGIPDSLIAREEQLQSDINFYSLQLADRPDSSQIALLQEELLASRKAYKTLIDDFERNFPAYYELRYADPIVGEKNLQEALPAGTALISYFTGKNELYIFYLDKDRHTVYQTAIDETFPEEIAAYRQTINERYDDAYPVMARRLYPKLFPFQLPASIKNLVLVPDGQLTTIPFEALLREEVGENATFSSLPYLLRDFHMSYAPSASLYHQLHSGNPAADNEDEVKGLLAYAPVFGEEAETTPATRDLLENFKGEQRMYTPDGQYITPLPGTAFELDTITRIFSSRQVPVQSYLHAEATEERIKSPSINSCEYLHIATHGFINEDQPDLSGLLFYPDTSSTENDILSSGEVYSLKLRAKLVVLSACETGMGKINTGEGILGLSRAFLYAGAGNLIVSLWKVDDRATADLMAGFYSHHLQIGERMPFQQSLRQAKLNLIQSETFSAPYFWSAFVLIGE